MKVICYIDGFNLYHGVRSLKLRKYYWLDLWALAERFLKPGQALVEVVYCTALVKNDPPVLQRQMTFLDALQAYRPNSKVVYGYYLAKTMTCHNCGHAYVRQEEKMTDVNIACHMLTDAMAERFDVALLVSGDSDLVPPVRNIRQHWPNKQIIAMFPPNRHSEALKNAVHGYVRIREDKLRQCQLPDVVPLQSNGTINRPDHWR